MFWMFVEYMTAVWKKLCSTRLPMADGVGDVLGAHHADDRHEELVLDERMRLVDLAEKEAQIVAVPAEADLPGDERGVLADPLLVRALASRMTFSSSRTCRSDRSRQPLRVKLSPQLVGDGGDRDDLLLGGADDVVVDRAPATMPRPATSRLAVSSTTAGGLPGPAAMTFLPDAMAACTTPGPPVTTTRRMPLCLHERLGALDGGRGHAGDDVLGSAGGQDRLVQEMDAASRQLGPPPGAR